MSFNDVYWAAQPLEVQALRGMQDPDRTAKAQELAQEGFVIDVPIQVFGWDPMQIMTIRQSAGMEWVPSATQKNIQLYLVGAQQPDPPYAPYDPTKPPAGSIKVSVDPADYPPVVKPVPPPQPATNLVSSLVFGNLYGPGPGAMKDSRTPNVADGQVITQDGMNFTAHISHGLMGISVTFTKN